MNKSELIPFKHILISREGQVYWYIDENTIASQNHNDEYNKYNMICLSTGCDRIFDRYWQENLVAKRDEWEGLYEEPRKKDIIYVYEITDHYDFFYIARKIKFSKLTDYKNYIGRSCLKLVYERIDGMMELN